MSNIYEALRKSGEVGASCVVESIGEDGSQSWQTAPPVINTNPSQSGGEKVSEPRAIAESAPRPSSLRRHGYRVAPLRIGGGVVFPFDGSHPQAAEQYRILRTNLLQHSLKPTVIAVSSPCAGDGKTITAINLAGILALKSDVAVLLVEADLRKSGISPILGIDLTPGLAEVLRKQCTLKDAIVQIEQIPNLHVLPAGHVGSNPAELLDSTLCGKTIATLREAFSFVIVDTAPATIVADFNLIKVLCDGTVLVVRADHTDRDSFSKTIKANKDGLLGIVINSIEPWFLWKVQDYNYYPRK